MVWTKMLSVISIVFERNHFRWTRGHARRNSYTKHLFTLWLLFSNIYTKERRIINFKWWMWFDILKLPSVDKLVNLNLSTYVQVVSARFCNSFTLLWLSSLIPQLKHCVESRELSHGFIKCAIYCFLFMKNMILNYNKIFKSTKTCLICHIPAFEKLVAQSR